MIEETRRHRLTGQEIAIPARIQTLIISHSPQFKLRAVVITEHRNLDFNASELSPYVKNVLFLQVGSHCHLSR